MRAIKIRENALGQNHPDVSNSINNLAGLYLEQDKFEAAATLYERALRIEEEVFGPTHANISSILNNIGTAYVEQKKYAEAEPVLLRSLAISENIFGSEHPELVSVLHNMALLYYGQDRYEEAEATYKKVLEIADKTFGSNHFWLVSTLRNRSLLYQAMGREVDALTDIRRASRIAKIYKQSIEMSKIDQTFDQYSSQDIFLLHLKLLIQSSKKSNEHEILSETFEAVQMSSDNNLGATIHQMTARLDPSKSEIAHLIRRRQDAALNWAKLDRELISAFGKPIDERDKLLEAKYAKQLEANAKLLRELDTQLSVSFPKLYELSSPRPLSLSDTQDLLGLNEGLFTFVSDEETEATYAFMVTKDDARAYKVDLSEAQIAEIVRTLRTGIDLSNSFGIGDLPNFDMNLSYDLYSSLFGPAEDMLDGVEHLLVVPTGPLESLPLNLLVTEKPEIDPAASVFDNYQAAAWLPKSYSLTRLPSVSSLRALRVFAAAGEAKEPFIGFGDPILNGDAGDLRGLELASVYRGTTADIDQVRNLPELPDTADELKRIAQYLRASDDKIYLRERATETVLKNTDLTNSRVVAFATHGLVGGEISGLAEPALVLSPPDEATEEDDGLLKASEVAQLKMNADIIMLSACNTASGDELGAEGLSGLARAFIYAGARSLLVSHWSVESTSAAELTTGMFDAMSADKSIGRSEALQMSMVDLMTDKERSYYSHPAFWAPFSLVGDGATLN
jgi:CHAT domain-containing protein